MIKRQMDPAQLSGKALADWYQRTPDEIQDERNQREQEEYDAFFGGLRSERTNSPAGSWQEADASRPLPRVPYARPRSPRADRAPMASAVDGAIPAAVRQGAFSAAIQPNRSTRPCRRLSTTLNHRRCRPTTTY